MPKEGETMELFDGFDRVAVAVRDLEKAMTFFTDVFGITFDEVIDDEAAGVKAVYSRFGLELVSPMPVDKPFALSLQQFLEEKGEGVNVVTIMVGDMDRAMQHIKDRGIKPIALLSAGKGREAIFDPKDFYGIPIVLNECPDPHPMTTAVLVPGTKKAIGAVLIPANVDQE
jgi:methylmalonyl-CoA/ethylmalonyl-CoA epimerase